MLTIVSACKSCGQASDNEDCLLVDRRRSLFGVFDGVGGRGNGRLASHCAAQTIRQEWKILAVSAEKDAPAQLVSQLEGLVQFAHQQILLLQQQQDAAHSEVAMQKPPATTATLALFTRSAGRLWLIYAHIGDSRIYHLPSAQAIQRVTEDDEYFSWMMHKNQLSQEESWQIEQAVERRSLSEEAWQHFSRRNKITSALGWEGCPKVHTDVLELAEGDRLVLCSDGVHDNLTDREIEQQVRKAPFASSARRLVQVAYRRSQQEHLRAKKDDISAIVVQYQQDRAVGLHPGN